MNCEQSCKSPFPADKRTLSSSQLRRRRRRQARSLLCCKSQWILRLACRPCHEAMNIVSGPSVSPFELIERSSRLRRIRIWRTRLPIRTNSQSIYQA